MEVLFIIGGFLLAAIIWVNVLATIAIRYDPTLESFQKRAQFLFVWLVPILGASFVLKLVFEHSPETIPKKWIPWPLKDMIYGKPIQANKNRDEREIDPIYTRSRNNNDFGDSSGGGD